MKTSILVAAFVTCIMAVQMASAQDKAVASKPAMSMPMDAQMSKMHTNVTLMRSQMDKIHATTTPKERRQLMQAHMQTMQASMAMMRGMNKPMTMDGGQASGMANGSDKGMMGGDMMKHHQMMDERMGMMQTMMEQMLQHQQMMESMPAQ